jgi:hypothetical protein
MVRAGNQGIIAQWKEALAVWAQMNRTNPHAEAVNAWLPFWQPRPFYTADELAPLWPALGIVTGFTDKWPSVIKSARRLENELDFHGLPRLPAPWRDYFIVERIHFWRGATTKRLSGRCHMHTVEDMVRAGCTTRRGVRFWEEKGMLGPVERTAGDTRRYTPINWQSEDHCRSAIRRLVARGNFADAH